MNKGFEMIEAKWLFGMPPEKIEIVIHPQSIVHSMIQYSDGAIKAQLGLPDMKLPIRYALSYPDRLCTHAPKLQMEDYARLTFERPDTERFPLLHLAFDAIAQGGNMPCIMNAANEIAVAAFLAGEIGFYDIVGTIIDTMAEAFFIASPTYDDYVATDLAAREIATRHLKRS